MRAAPMDSYLVLLRVGFTMPQPVASCAVRSYRTLSPLPALLRALRRSALCCTFRRLAPPRRYLALCPMEPGLSSPMHQTTLKRVFQLTPERLSGRLRGRTLLVETGKCKLRICSLTVFFANFVTKSVSLIPTLEQSAPLTGIFATLRY
jgi:hypothetical protein